MPARLADLIRQIPKAELHVHVEGTLEPEMALALAERNAVELPYASVEALRAAFDFGDLQDFLDLYYSLCEVLRTERDFYDLTWAYLERAAADNVAHVELFFDPQTHTARGVELAAVIGGIQTALDDGACRLAISSRLILCFLRHLSQVEAHATLDEAAPFVGSLAAVGLDSSERGNPPSKFAQVFARARDMGLRAVAHAGEEAGPDYIIEALDILAVDRIDHGVRCEEDDSLLARLAREQVPLTVCPLSNVRLRVFDTLDQHNLKRLLDRGLCVTVNSDDPAYFGGYVVDNYVAVAEALALDATDIVALATNSVRAAFVEPDRRAELLAAICGFVTHYESR